jgi:hypothetical protein
VTLDGYAGVWWFSTSSAYYAGRARKHQDPVRDLFGSFEGRQSLEFVSSTGATTRRGPDFNTFNVTWQLVTF